MKRKLFNKIAVAALSMVACATCFGVTANAGSVSADNGKVTLPGGSWTDVSGYSLVWGSTGAVANAELYATPVTKTNAKGQTLKGVELSSSQTYTLNNSQWYPVNGYSMGYGQYLTLKVDEVIDMSEPVEFLFAPYVIGGKGGQANHRFVMALSDTNGEIKPLTGSSQNGFNATGEDANYIYWEFLKHQQWANAAAPETQGNGPNWYAVSSEGTTATGYAESYDNIANAPTKNDITIANSRIAGGALGRAFYGAEYPWADLDSQYTVNSAALIKAKIEFTETQMVLTFDHVFEQDLDNKEPNAADKVCTATHDLSVESGVTCTACYFKQTYNLADLGFTYGESELNLYFGYYNVHARFGGQSYGDLPMSLKLYNYKNGEIKSFGVKAGKEEMSIAANEEIALADVMDIQYFDGVATPTATISYASSNEAIATIVDGKVVPTANTFGGEVTITATASTGETASFKVTVDANTVTLNGEVIAAGDSYTILEGLYAGNKVLVGYMMDGGLYAVGDTITLTKDVVLEEVTIDFTMLYGASVRLDATASIRFTAIINMADFAALETLVGANNVSYGMTLAAAGNTYDINSKNDNFKTSTYENSYTLYSAVMKGIPETDYTTDLTAQAYLKVTYADGDVATISSLIAEKKAGDVKESNIRSLADVATAAYNDRQATEGGIYLYEISEGSYSPYTAEQLAELVKYIPAN